jgi:tellurite resistance protein
MRACVQAAIFLASADGKVEEAEVEALIDALRAILSTSVKGERVEKFSSVAWLIDEARLARRLLATNGEAAYLKALAGSVDDTGAQQVLQVAVQVADGQVKDIEHLALGRLAAALKLPPPTPRPA